MLAFSTTCPSLITAPHTSQFTPTHQTSSRPPIPASPARRPATRPPSMSLTNDLIVKALEVGVATFVGNSFVTTQAKKEEEKAGPFSIFRKKERRRDSKPPPVIDVESEQVQNIVAQVLKFAEQVPDIIQTGGPEGKKWIKLAICIGIDLVGSGSLAVPLLGDALDIVTAPLSAVMLQALFGSSFVTVGGFMEEILPGTDGIPTATLAWLAENNGYLVGDGDAKDGKR